MEEFVETFNRTSNQTIDLFQKTLSVYQAISLTDAQRRVQDLIIGRSNAWSAPASISVRFGALGAQLPATRRSI
jgi:hypothetical protein